MSRINLVMVDGDSSYLDSLANYILSNHSKWFQVSTFTNVNSLNNMLENTLDIVDILLIEPSLYSSQLPLDKVKSVFILSGGTLSEELSEFTLINKYQLVDTLVGDILRYHAEKGDGGIINMTGDKKTKVIGIYSPAGGVGKSSLAVNLSVQSAAQGSSVFYLNLEDINSTNHYFNGENDKTFSNVLFYLKEKGKNLGLKINALKSIDTSNVSYFPTQDSMLDMNDMSPDEIVLLINELIKIAQYDYIFVDMSSNLNKKNIAILKECYKIIYLLTPESVVQEKTKVLEKDFERILGIPNPSIGEKLILVANKYIYSNTWVDNYRFLDVGLSHKLPYENNFKPNGLNNSPNFNGEIYKILNEIK